MDDETKKQIEELEGKLEDIKAQDAEEKKKVEWTDRHRKIRLAKNEAARKIIEILTERELIAMVRPEYVCGLQKDILNAVTDIL